MLPRCEGGERCPARTRTCNKCGEFGHFGKSTLCKGRMKGLRKVQEEASSEEEVIRLKEEVVAGVTRVGEADSRIRVSLGVTKQGHSFRGEMKKTKLRFRPYGTNQYLPIRGRAAVKFRAKAWAMIETEVYVNGDRSEESSGG